MMGVLWSIVFWRKSTMVNDKELIIPFAQRSWSGVYWFHLVCLSETAINGSVVLGADESPWPCGTPSWYTPLSWTILSEENNLHLFLSQLICVFSKMSVPLSVPLSVCGQNLVRSVSSTIPGRSISYLYILSTNFRRCVACWVLWKILKFELFCNFFKFAPLTFSCVHVMWMLKVDSSTKILLQQLLIFHEDTSG